MIFEAIERGDAGAARRAVRNHIRGARDAALIRVELTDTEVTDTPGPADAPGLVAGA
jgi:hypothetical protein